MIVINNFENIYPEETLRYCNWERFNDTAIDCVLFNGGPQHTKEDFGDLPKILLYFEEQTWDLDSTETHVPDVDKILTILPMRISGRYNKRVSTFYPTNEEIIAAVHDSKPEKNYDVIYTGTLRAGGDHLHKIINTIPKFNHRWVSFDPHPAVTNSHITYFEKLRLIAESKIDVCHGLVGNGTPQTKSRYFEAAFCKSLILIHSDQWNIIEDWFTPGEDFLYWSTEQELEDLIADVVSDYDSYLPMVESAYQKAMAEYTTARFVEKYIGFKDV